MSPLVQQLMELPQYLRWTIFHGPPRRHAVFGNGRSVAFETIVARLMISDHPSPDSSSTCRSAVRRSSGSRREVHWWLPGRVSRSDQADRAPFWSAICLSLNAVVNRLSPRLISTGSASIICNIGDRLNDEMIGLDIFTWGEGRGTVSQYTPFIRISVCSLWGRKRCLIFSGVLNENQNGCITRDVLR